MHKELPGVKSPKDDDILWRYMSLEKFANILATKSLFFTRADKFEDPLEGYVPQAVRDLYEAGVSRVTPHPKLKNMVLKVIENWHKYVVCNCWHQNEVESMAMWEKYHMRNSGIAIKTTMQDLKKSLIGAYDVFTGKVQYIDDNNYEHHHIQNFFRSDVLFPGKWTYFPHFRKRTEFEYENEVRLIIDSEPFIRDYMNVPADNANLEAFLNNEFPVMCEIGIPLDINVNTLIHEVIISPYTQDWVTETVKSVVYKYGYDFPINGFNFPVSRSKLLDPPD